MATSADTSDGWQVVRPNGHSRTEQIDRAQQEALERLALEHWAGLDGDWSGSGKHTTDVVEAKKLHHRLRSAGLQQLGRGGQGIVEKLQWTHKNKSVWLARKRLRGLVDILREEANILERLCHEHIVRLVGTYGYHHKELYLLLWPAATRDLADLLNDLDDLRFDGGDRTDILERLEHMALDDTYAIDSPHGAVQFRGASGDRCPLTYLRRIMGCLTDAVRYCHDSNIRHLDLKPENILVSPGRVHLADFGISRDVSDQEHTNTYLEIGTKKWFAPERFSSSEGWSMKATEVWTLGLIFMNIATIIYGSHQSNFFDILKQNDWQVKLRQMGIFLEELQKLALATQQVADEAAHTIAPKHIVGLIKRMTSFNPDERPSTMKINDELVWLGGIEQIYHNSCCKAPARTLTQRFDRKYVEACTQRDRLVEENERAAKRLRTLVDREDMYELRIQNEREKHSRDRANLVRQLEEEQRHRTQLEERVRELEQGRRHRPGMSGHQRRGSGNLTMKSPRPHSKSPSQHFAKPIVPVVTAVVPTRLPSPKPTQRPSPDLRTSTECLTNYALRSRGSGSRLPQPINPSTPIRSGTPSTPRDTDLTNSTVDSMASSMFSRVSRRTTSSGLSPNPSPSASKTLIPPSSTRAENDHTATSIAPGSYFQNGPPTRCLPELISTKPQSVDDGASELGTSHDGTSQAGTENSDMPVPRRKISLPAQKSWAAVAGDRHGLASMVGSISGKKRKAPAVASQK